MNAIIEQDDALLYLKNLLAENPKRAGHQRVAAQLAGAINRAYPFSTAYLENIVAERQPMSNRLARAIYMLKRERATAWKNAEKQPPN